MQDEKTERRETKSIRSSHWENSKGFWPGIYYEIRRVHGSNEY